jgi:hypothetical protein
MNSTAKVLVPNKEWLVQDGGNKIGSISKVKKGYAFLRNGKQVNFNDLAEITAQFGVAVFEEKIKKVKSEQVENKNYAIYDFPCSSKPYDPMYNVKKKLRYIKIQLQTNHKLVSYRCHILGLRKIFLV